MIKVKPNKNIIFLTLIINFQYPKDCKKFYLYKSFSKEFDKLIPKSFINDFKKVYKDENPLAILYRYVSLSIYLDDDFVFNFIEKEEREFLQFNKFSKDISFFKNQLAKLYYDIDFKSFYNQKIKGGYEKVCSEIQNIFDKKPNIEETLIDFWGLDFKPEVIFIPNIVALGDCFGLQRDNIFFSITSPKIEKLTGKAEYSSVHIYRNTIHELSHSFFKESIDVKYSEEELKDKVEKLGLRNDILKTYGLAYFEECFVRACTMRLNEILNVYDVGKKELEEKIENYLVSNDNLGYHFVRLYYQKLKESKNKSLQDIFSSSMDLSSSA